VRLLHPVLNGLAKFGHLMSIEYFQDVLAAFKVLLDDDDVPIQNYEKLLCLKTVFAILGGQGDHLTLDPAR
jgi:nucleolar complex protein 3